MNEKDFNLAILNKLYEIAQRVFGEGVNVPDGSYNATELAKKGDSIFKAGYLQTETKQVKEYNKETHKDELVDKDCFVAPMTNVSLLSFVCSFCVVRIFHLVAKFEKLAGIPTKERRLFVAANNIGNVLRTFEIEINKGLGTLSKFIDMKDELRPLMKNVCLDMRYHRAVASNGHVLQIRQFAVCAGSAWDEDLGYYYPLVRADVWKKMCDLAGKGAKVTCKLVGDDIHNTTGNYWICECKGITCEVAACRYVNYRSVIAKVDPSKVAQLDKKTWNAAKKWIKSSSVTNDILVIKHEEGSARLTFKMRDLDFNIENETEFNCVGIPYEKFALCVKASTLVKVVDEFNLYLPESANRALYFISDKDIKLVMPLILDDREDNYQLDMTDKKSPFYIAGFQNKEQIALLDGSANNRTQSVESAKVVSNTTEQKEEPTERKNEPAKVVDAPAKVQIKVASKATLDADSKKFTFDKVGVKVGDVLTFVDGTEVIAAENNKVSFCDETFTLSGFCKAFMPDDKRTKSNAYRGCDYFYKDGVKLGKLLKEYQKTLVATLESKEEEVASAKVETLDDAPSEPAQTEETTAKVVNLSSASVETTERTITPSAKDIAAERKELTQNANNVVCDVGILAKVVGISLGVPPECAEVASGTLPTTEPPNNLGVRLVDVGCKLSASDVGSYSLVGGKVIHTLPLPPPRTKKTSYNRKLLYHLLIRKQKWKQYHSVRT